MDFNEKRSLLVSTAQVVRDGERAKFWMKIGNFVLMAFSLIFFMWAVFNTEFQGFGLDFGVMCFPVSFVGGMTGVYAATHTSRTYTGVHTFLQALGLGNIILIYGSTGFNVIFKMLDYVIPCWVWMIFICGLLTVSSFSSSADVPNTYEQTPAPSRRLMLIFSSLWMAASAFYFFWAFINTYHANVAGNLHALDLGVVCFAFSFMAGVAGVYAAVSRSETIIRVHLATTVIGLISIVVCYCLGIAYALTLPASVKSHYLIVWIPTLAVWIIAGILFILLNRRHSHQVRVSATRLG